MTPPTSSRQPTAAELDRAYQGRQAYDAAIRDGKSHDDAVQAARDKMSSYAKRQFLRSLGYSDRELDDLGYD